MVSGRRTQLKEGGKSRNSEERMKEEEKIDFTALLPPNWTSTITPWLEEDLPSFDVGGFVVGGTAEKYEHS